MAAANPESKRARGRLTILSAVLVLASATAATEAKAQVVPLADHHVHLISPQAALGSVPPMPPPVAVPADIARLLKARAAAVGDAKAMAALYDGDVRILHPLYPAWLHGEEALDTLVTTPKGYRLVPSLVRKTADAAFVAGTWVKGEGADARNITNFFLDAHKVRGQWKIVAEGFTAKGPPRPKPVLAKALIGELDEAGIRRAEVLSIAYQVDAEPGDTSDQEYRRVQAENDWVIAQAAEYPERLVPYCGVNPLKPYAVAEVERCSTVPSVRGIKLHLGNAGLDLRQPAQVAALGKVVAAADARGLAITIHVMTANPDYGAEDARIFLEQIVPLARHVPIQVAHLAGAGPGYDADEAMAVFASAAQRHDPRLGNLWFDVASTVGPDTPKASLDLVAKRIREVGPGRILFGSDRSAGNNPPGQAWLYFHRLPLRDQEFADIADNVFPPMKL